MISAGTILRAHLPIWNVTMKPTGLNGKRKRGPEFSCVVQGEKADAIRKARQTAEMGGFIGYAITNIKEVSDG